MAGKLVTIATFGHSSEAHIARSALETAGIPVRLNNEETTSLFGPASTAFGSIRLVVREEDEERAVKVLDEAFADTPLTEEELAAQAEAEAPEDVNEAAEQPLAPVNDPAADSLAREKDAHAAVAAALLGFVLPFASLFAIVMIISAASGPGKLSRRGWYHVIAAGVLIFLVPVALVLVWLYWVGE